MDAIKLYLERFKDLRPVDDQLKEATATAIKEVCGAVVDKRWITVKNWAIHLEAPAALKSEVYIHREQIMEKITAQLSQLKLKRIV